MVAITPQAEAGHNGRKTLLMFLFVFVCFLKVQAVGCTVLYSEVMYIVHLCASYKHSVSQFMYEFRMNVRKDYKKSFFFFLLVCFSVAEGSPCTGVL